MHEWSRETLNRFPIGERYLIGVSGGRDSVALLHWLLACGYRRLIVCHLDHQLRGQISRVDARFVRRTSEAAGLSFELGESNVRDLATEQKQSVEAAGRAARYSFFAAVARRRRCRTIFLGHHADDLVETFLMNLFRGAGLRGQRGMQIVSDRVIDKRQLRIVRPLLGVSRSEIDAYAKTHRLKFRDDASNDDVTLLRNRVRHRVIPMLRREFGRDIQVTVRRAALIAADEDALLDQLAHAEFQSSPKLKVATLLELPIALRRRAILHWLRRIGIADASFDMIEKVR
ncbi:MAG: tRNA lysidine(34) synthetase TilS, partial [Verrucomicrobiota bacterium]|nr:tRNA lysidine(34) synthetase TilS [Verrucomicrobiota bacterium]